MSTCKCYPGKGRLVLLANQYYASLGASFAYQPNGGNMLLLRSGKPSAELQRLFEATRAAEEELCHFTLDNVECNQISAGGIWQASIRNHDFLSTTGETKDAVIASLAIVLAENGYSFDFGD